MKAQLSLSEVVSGKAEIIYRAKQTGNETIYFNILAATNTGTSMIAPEVNGKRRLCTFDSTVKNISEYSIYRCRMQIHGIIRNQ